MEPVANSVEAFEAALQEIRPEDAAAILADPVFTPMTVRPEIRNRAEIIAALTTEHPAALRAAGIGGTAVVLFYVSDTGQVLHNRVGESSGHEGLDQAALKVAAVYEFTPAQHRGEPVPVWIQLPITFDAR